MSVENVRKVRKVHVTDLEETFPLWTADELARRALVETGASVLANVRKDAALIAWAKGAGLLVPIHRDPKGRITDEYPWGNPFKLGRDGDRDTVCNLYADHLRRSPALQARLPELQRKVLVCWCHPKRCHGGELLKALAEVTS